MHKQLLVIAGALAIGLFIKSPEAQGSIVDPAGDTFGAGAVKPDIVSVIANANLGISVQFTVNYAAAIAAPSAFAANSVTGYIDLDTDQNAATGGSAPWGGPVAGGNSWINFFIGAGLVPPPTIALGDEFYTNLFSESSNPGLVDIHRTSDNALTGTVPILFAATSFSFTIPVGVLGGDDGILNYGLVTGTFSEPTDRAPNGDNPGTTDVITDAIPEPSGILAFSLVFGSMFFRRRNRKVLVQV